MSKPTSPLRYPGGKSCLYGLMSELLIRNKQDRLEYAEPFAGGAGLALHLLYDGLVSNIHINDIDVGIWSFWNSVLNETEALVSLIESTEVTMEEWYKQKKIVTESTKDTLTLGFATFFLNRTNRSGIIKKAGVIGGYKQLGNYKLDCRFNKENLIHRIRRVAKYRNRIFLTNLDAVDFLENKEGCISQSAFYCIDPPYFEKGAGLYTNFYEKEDHAELSEAVMRLKSRWIVTYDNAEEIRRLYKERRKFCFDLNYSVQTKRIGTELLIASKGLLVSKDLRERQVKRIKV